MRGSGSEARKGVYFEGTEGEMDIISRRENAREGDYGADRGKWWKCRYLHKPRKGKTKGYYCTLFRIPVFSRSVCETCEYFEVR